MRLGTKRKTFSEYDWAVARSRTCFLSKTSMEFFLRLVVFLVRFAIVCNRQSIVQPQCKLRRGGVRKIANSGSSVYNCGKTRI